MNARLITTGENCVSIRKLRVIKAYGENVGRYLISDSKSIRCVNFTIFFFRGLSLLDNVCIWKTRELFDNLSDLFMCSGSIVDTNTPENLNFF